MFLPVWKSTSAWVHFISRDDAAVLARVERRGTDIATPSSRRRVDGVEDDGMIQDERAVNLISTQVPPTNHRLYWYRIVCHNKVGISDPGVASKIDLTDEATEVHPNL